MSVPIPLVMKFPSDARLQHLTSSLDVFPFVESSLLLFLPLGGNHTKPCDKQCGYYPDSQSRAPSYQRCSN